MGGLLDNHERRDGFANRTGERRTDKLFRDGGRDIGVAHAFTWEHVFDAGILW